MSGAAFACAERKLREAERNLRELAASKEEGGDNMQRKRFGLYISASKSLALVALMFFGQAAALPLERMAAEQAAAAGGAPVSEKHFSDIGDHWASEAIRWAIGRGIVDGYEDGTFRPDKLVTEAEFLAMLLRADPGAKLPESGLGAPWYAKYYAYAAEKEWPIRPADAGNVCLRVTVAEIVAAALGQRLEKEAAVRWLLEQRLAEGKTAATVEGFAGNDPLTRAEAVKFIQNVAERLPALGDTTSQSRRAVQVDGVAIGDAVSKVIETFGEPARKDASEYGFEWYIYNRDYRNYTQIGVQDGKVVALYSAGERWATDRGIRIGSTESEVRRIYGDPLEAIRKGNTRFILSSQQTNTAVYLLEGGYVTFFYDKFLNNTVAAVQVVERSVEESLRDFYGAPSERLRESYERQIFDLANAFRVRMGKAPFTWDETIAETARKHSRDMAEREYFAHVNPDGLSPFDRMKADGIQYLAAAENIAAGLSNAIFAHAGWINSEGHRANLLGETSRLGVGVFFGGKMSVYYTQNFYTPLR
jgi:uncharacterized protein YkwD